MPRRHRFGSLSFWNRDRIRNFYSYPDATFTLGGSEQQSATYAITSVDPNRSIVVGLYGGEKINEETSGTEVAWAQSLYLTSATVVTLYASSGGAGTFPLPFVVIEFSQLIRSVQRGRASFTCSNGNAWNTESITISGLKDHQNCLPILDFNKYDMISGSPQLGSMYPKVTSPTLLNIYAHNESASNCSVVNFGWQVVEFGDT